MKTSNLVSFERLDKEELDVIGAFHQRITVDGYIREHDVSKNGTATAAFALTINRDGTMNLTLYNESSGRSVHFDKAYEHTFNVSDLTEAIYLTYGIEFYCPTVWVNALSGRSFVYELWTYNFWGIKVDRVLVA